jgi:pimeloyl-ACP methyl ester carboxylesterase
MSCWAPIARFAAALILASLTAPASAQSNVADVPLADGGSERVLFAGSPSPTAILIMLAGGDGVLEISDSGTITRLGGNFLLRTRALWLGQGFAVVILGPSNGSSLLGQRHTPAYADAIGRAADFVRTRANAPIWLVGTSQGSTAAANGASHLGRKIAGVVLTSSVTRQNNSGETVFDSELGAIAVPTLIVANQGDTCPSTPAADAARIAAALTRSPRSEIVYVQSDRIQSPPCDGMSPHGYLGIEPAVVQRISDWIRTTPTR